MRDRTARYSSLLPWFTAAVLAGVLLTGGCGLDDNIMMGENADQTDVFLQTEEPVARGAAAELEAIPAAPLSSLQWVRGGIPSCDNSCGSVGRTAVSSGTYPNGETFYICTANAHNEGFRGGYNLRPHWADACIVGWGGREEATTPYWCLCH